MHGSALNVERQIYILIVLELGANWVKWYHIYTTVYKSASGYTLYSRIGRERKFHETILTLEYDGMYSDRVEMVCTPSLFSNGVLPSFFSRLHVFWHPTP